MSVLFPKVNKAPEWNWRPIYYDPKKDEMHEKLKKLQDQRAVQEAEKAAQEAAKASQQATQAEPSAATSTEEYTPTLHRGSFREYRSENMSTSGAARQSKMAFWFVLLLMLGLLLYFLQQIES